METPQSPFKMPASPATPLQQLSPDRMNQQRIPASPSLPNHLSSAESKASRQSIDVQSKVAFINSLNQGGSPSRQQGCSVQAALQRALLGREEAETALRTSSVHLAEAETRQRKISERVETLMEELQALRNRQSHERQVFEKEVRKARKDAFRAGSGLVTVQEDLKESRTEARNLRADVQRERHEKEKSKQEAFERAYTLAGLLEEVEMMREKLQAVEATREAEVLEQRSSRSRQEDRPAPAESPGEEDQPTPAESHGQGDQATPTESHGQDARQNRFERKPAVIQSNPDRQATLPGRPDPEPQRRSLAGNEQPTDDGLAAELRWERRLRGRAEDMVHFLQMECQFQACACRRAERDGRRFVHDREYDGTAATRRSIRHDAVARPDEDDMFNICRQTPRPATKAPEPPNPSPSTGSPISATHTDSSQIIIGSAVSAVSSSSDPASSTKDDSDPAEDMTYQSPQRTMARPRSACAIALRHPTGPTTTPAPPLTPQRPGPLRIVRSHTTTTVMIPLRNDDHTDTNGFFSSSSSSHSKPAIAIATPTTATAALDQPFLPTPGTPVSREAALAQIRARRDRARSLAGRWITSAPTASASSVSPATTSSAAAAAVGTPGASARRGLAGGVRDVSAPGRF